MSDDPKQAARLRLHADMTKIRGGSTDVSDEVLAEIIERADELGLNYGVVEMAKRVVNERKFGIPKLGRDEVW